MKDVSDDFRALHQTSFRQYDEQLAWQIKNKCETALWGRLWMELERTRQPISLVKAQISALQPDKSVVK